MKIIKQLAQAKAQVRIKVLIYLLKRCTYSDLPIMSCRWSDPLLKYILEYQNKYKLENEINEMSNTNDL